MQDPLIYHITHIDNLAGILRDGCLWCDSQRIGREIFTTNIGHLHIKERRLRRRVQTQAGGCLGDYVPFNFCPRSVMLFAVRMGHADYAGGQDSVLHLVSRVSLAAATGRPWVFSDRHAELEHAHHFDDLARLDEVRWDVMPLQYWREFREERQAEFLLRDSFPWSGIETIGVRSVAMAKRVGQGLEATDNRPPVQVHPEWYY